LAEAIGDSAMPWQWTASGTSTSLELPARALSHSNAYQPTKSCLRTSHSSNAFVAKIAKRDLSSWQASRQRPAAGRGAMGWGLISALGLASSGNSDPSLGVTTLHRRHNPAAD